MAFQARGRDPLFDSDMAAAIEKRGKELAGVALVVLGLMAAALIGSYTPEDPSWMSSTDAPVQNWLGRIGASIAAPLMMIVGKGSWALAGVLLAWGVRLAAHAGEERAGGRVIFAPLWVALAAVFAAGLDAAPDWSHSFGMGGLFGDMALGTAMNLLPLGQGASLSAALVLAGLGTLGVGLFVMGFSRSELRRIGQAGLLGAVLGYAGLLRLAGRSASGALTGAQTVQAAYATRRDRRISERAENEEWASLQSGGAPAPRVRRARPEPEEPVLEDDWEDAPAPERGVGGLLARMPSLIRRGHDGDPAELALPQPELVETAAVRGEIEAPGEDRVRERIADAIRARLRATPEARIAAEAPLTRGRGRRPDPLIADTSPRRSLP
ncbi:DNA translocase FtsK 4TM domain-containing protein, partial [Roseivivax sp. CAU 1761]